MVYLDSLRNVCRLFLRSVQLITSRGIAMENQIDTITAEDHAHLVDMYILVEFKSVMDALLYQHFIEGNQEF